MYAYKYKKGLHGPRGDGREIEVGKIQIEKPPSFPAVGQRRTGPRIKNRFARSNTATLILSVRMSSWPNDNASSIGVSRRHHSSRHRNTRIIYIKVYCKYYSCGHASRPWQLHMFSSFVPAVNPLQIPLSLSIHFNSKSNAPFLFSFIPPDLSEMKKKSKCYGSDWIGIRLSLRLVFSHRDRPLK